MCKLIAPILAAMLWFSSQELSAASPLGTQLESTTVRLRRETSEGDYTVTGHGSAFGIDLSSYGLSGKRYLLSAGHCVLGPDGAAVAPTQLRVEVGQPGAKQWRQCRVVAVDTRHDLSLLECDTDLEVLCQLAPAEPQIGSALLIVGCPKGVLPRVSAGRLISKAPPVSGQLWQAQATFWHGNSGGPVFDSKQQLLGVALAGIKDDATGDMENQTALFAPPSVLRTFLDKCVRQLSVARPKAPRYSASVSP